MQAKRVSIGSTPAPSTQYELLNGAAQPRRGGKGVLNESELLHTRGGLQQAEAVNAAEAVTAECVHTHTHKHTHTHRHTHIEKQACD